MLALLRPDGRFHATICAMTDPGGGWASPGGWTPPADLAPPPLQKAPLDEVPAPLDPRGWQAPTGWGGPASGPGGWGSPRPPEARPGVVPLRPLGLGELLDGAVALVRRYPRPALGLSAAVAAVSTLLNIVLALTALRPLLSFDPSTFRLDGGTGSGTGQLDGALGGAALGGLGGAVVSALGTLVLTGAMTAIAGRGVLGQPTTFAQTWAQVRPVLLRLLVIAFLTALCVYGSVVLAVAGAVGLVAVLGLKALLVAVPLGLAGAGLAAYLYCRLALAPCAAVLESAGVRTSLRRSGVLVRRSWWRICGILVLTVIISSIVAQIVQVPFLLFGALPSGLGSLLSPGGTTGRLLVVTYIGAGVAQTVVAPFTSGVRALLYVDRRMRAEGLDVALAAAAHQPAR